MQDENDSEKFELASTLMPILKSCKGRSSSKDEDVAEEYIDGLRDWYDWANDDNSAKEWE